jgi:hypothetical protein
MEVRPWSVDRIGEAGLRTPTDAICGGGDFDNVGVFPLFLVFSSSVFLPSFQNDRLVDLPLLVVGSAADSVVSAGSGSLADDLQDSVDWGNDPGSNGAIDPRDSVSVGRAPISLGAIDISTACCARTS